uniref:Uncharacterized protein n=1 Tax=Lotus japonicus TaxID=34305 RepID=I3SG91_LOTJA|nr:unknown [Lotus japonicus]
MGQFRQKIYFQCHNKMMKKKKIMMIRIHPKMKLLVLLVLVSQSQLPKMSMQNDPFIYRIID